MRPIPRCAPTIPDVSWRGDPLWEREEPVWIPLGFHGLKPRIIGAVVLVRPTDEVRVGVVDVCARVPRLHRSVETPEPLACRTSPCREPHI